MDVEKLIEHLERRGLSNGSSLGPHSGLYDEAADVAEVVRCKDCQYYQDAKINKKGFLICPASGMGISETDYCSYGTRMGQENKHKVRCAKCRKIKEIVCTVDGKPWCEDCFDKAMGCEDQV